MKMMAMMRFKKKQVAGKKKNCVMKCWPALNLTPSQKAFSGNLVKYRHQLTFEPGCTHKQTKN